MRGSKLAGFAAVLLLALVVLPGCAQSGWSLWPWGQKKPTPNQFGIISPAEKRDGLRKLSDKARGGSDEERRRTTEILAELVQKERDPLIRADIVRALENYPNEKSLAVLLAAMKDPEPDVRVVACEVLGRRKGPDVVPALSQTLTNDLDVDVRLAAAEALGQCRDASAKPALAQALDDANPAMQYRAVESLRLVTGQDFGNDVARWRQYAKGQPVDPPKPVSVAEKMKSWF